MSPARTSHRTLRSVLAALGAGVVFALTATVGASPAYADTTLQDAITSLRNGDVVYVAPDASPTMTQAEADQLKARVRNIGSPFFIAVVPKSAAVGGSSDTTLRALADGVGRSGTYALYIGDSFRAGNDRGKVGDLATVAYADYRDQGVFAVLDAFVASAGKRINGKDGGSTNVAAVGGVLLGGAALLGAGGFYAYRRTQKVNAAKTAAVKRTVFEDVTAYGEKAALINVEDPRLDDAGRADAQRALDSYETAKMSADKMARPEDAATVTTALEDGRYALACVDARLAGQPVPERRPPCFVDPRHGPSVKDVTWSPDGGAPRAVPVCQACAVTLESGQLPAPREVEMAGGQRVPYWAAGRSYAPYAGGYYANSGADLMTLLFVGSMFGGAFSGPSYGGSNAGIGDSSGGGGFGDF